MLRVEYRLDRGSINLELIFLSCVLIRYFQRRKRDTEVHLITSALLLYFSFCARSYNVQFMPEL